MLLVETDPDNHLASSTSKQAFWSAFTTFNLTVMGNSVLPMPYAFSRTGAIVGLLTMLLVALCNDFTTLLMISAVYETGHDSYESLAQWAGGRPWKVRTGIEHTLVIGANTIEPISVCSTGLQYPTASELAERWTLRKLDILACKCIHAQGKA